MEEGDTSQADISGEEKKFSPLSDDYLCLQDYHVEELPGAGRRGYVSALPMGGELPPKNLPLDVPDEVPVKIGDQTIGVARTKRVPDGIEFEMEADWAETKREWIKKAFGNPLLPAEFSFDHEPPEQFRVPPYVEGYQKPFGAPGIPYRGPIKLQIPSKTWSEEDWTLASKLMDGGDEILAVNPDWHSIHEAKPGEPRPEPESDENKEPGQQPA